MALRRAEPDDRDFLFRLYASVRAEELAVLGWDAQQQDAFLRMQHMARESHYRASWPDADDCIVSVNGIPAGRLLVARTPDAFLLIDIALLPEYRNAGLGARLLQDLCMEADKAGRPVRLHVAGSNRAIRLYERLGFLAGGSDGIYLQMERPAPFRG